MAMLQTYLYLTTPLEDGLLIPRISKSTIGGRDFCYRAINVTNTTLRPHSIIPILLFTISRDVFSPLWQTEYQNKQEIPLIPVAFICMISSSSVIWS